MNIAPAARRGYALMRVASPAKINLSLSVGSIRADGFHAVDSFFHLINLRDELWVFPADEFSFKPYMYTPYIDLGIADEDNLVVKAAMAMADLHGKELPAVELVLDKNIPHGAGLGGGSSNAAATIFALSKIWNLQVDIPQHLELAAQLGSDVALFLAPTTASVMTGRGEVLKESREALPFMPILIVKPVDAHSPTGAVYKAFDDNPQPQHDVDVWKNNLELAAIKVSPKTGEALNWLRTQKGLKTAQIAGSGSACWAQFATLDDRDVAMQKAEEKGYWAHSTTLSDKGIRELIPH
jgi:4-diphosphocytidyl-2-C-methyl-D-erythritol kinase